MHRTLRLVTRYGGEKPEFFEYPNGTRIYMNGLDNRITCYQTFSMRGLSTSVSFYPLRRGRINGACLGTCGHNADCDACW